MVKLISKKRKNSSLTKKKSLVGLTPEQHFQIEMQSGELTGSGNETPHVNVLFSFSGQRFESTIGGTRDRAHKEERGSGPGDNPFQKYTPID